MKLAIKHPSMCIGRLRVLSRKYEISRTQIYVQTWMVVGAGDLALMVEDSQPSSIYAWMLYGKLNASDPGDF